MAVSNSPIALRWWIACELRRLRQVSGRTRQQAAERLGKATAQIGHLETGRNLPSAADVEVLLSWYGCPERVGLFRDLLRSAKRGRDWWADYADVVAESFGLFLGLESSAAQIHAYSAMRVPDLLQTPAYAEATIRGASPGAADHEIARMVGLRMARQDILVCPDEPPQIWAVLDEGLLRRPIGGSQVLSEQLNRLVEISSWPRITVQVLPSSAAQFASDSSFVWLSLAPELEITEGIVYVQTLVESLYYEEPDEIHRYREALDLLRLHALNPEESVTLIEKLVHEFGG